MTCFRDESLTYTKKIFTLFFHYQKFTRQQAIHRRTLALAREFLVALNLH
jgi:hypothetical protein